eukprot:COSAG06_NODE_1840_length_8239_cov_3.113145_8_plen_198_part_00
MPWGIGKTENKERFVCVSGFPLNYILLLLGNEEGAGKTSNLRSMKVARLAKLLKLLRIARAGRIIKRHEDTVMPLIITTGLVLLSLFLLHSLACFWFLTGLVNADSNCIGRTYGGHTGGQDFDCNGVGWVIRKGWRDPIGSDGHPCHTGDDSIDCPMGPAIGITDAYTTALADIFLGNVEPQAPSEKAFVVFAQLIM